MSISISDALMCILMMFSQRKQQRLHRRAHRSAFGSTPHTMTVWPVRSTEAGARNSVRSVSIELVRRVWLAGSIWMCGAGGIVRLCEWKGTQTINGQ